jgi:Cu/Ag efflux pump CusA
MERERRLLQQSVAIVATIPVATGLYGVLFGQALTGDAVSISAENHFRYLSGLLLGIGLCFWSTLPSIETHTGRFRLLTLLVVIGGLSRLIGLALTGLPSLFMLGGLIVELIVAPVLCLWQTRVANRYAEEYGVADA